jgi:hypothetical protein
MFGWGKKKPSKEAIEILKGLDKAIQNVHPDRFFDPLDAALASQPIIVLLNRIMGTPDEYRFKAVDYESWVSAVERIRAKGLMDRYVQVSVGDIFALSMLASAAYELRLRNKGEKEDAINLRSEVRESTKSMLMFLNKRARAKPEPK